MAQASDIAVKQYLRSSRLRLLLPASSYIAASAALLGLWIGYYLFDPFGFDEPGRDTWHHVAVLRELMAAPFMPSNPHVPTNEPSRYFTPVAVVAALFGKLLGLSPYRLFGYMGAASCVGLIAGCWMFARRYYGSPWAPLVLLLTLLFAWGTQMGHAGLHTYDTFLSSAAYPSTIALVLGLLSWAFAIRILQSDRIGAVASVGLGALSSVILLTHQLSGVIALAGTGSLILFYDGASIRSRTMLLAAVTLGCLSTIAWPYFQIIDIVSSVSDTRWRSANEAANHISTMLMLMAPSLVGVIGFRKADGAVRWELLFPAAFFGISYAILAIQGSAIAHRIPPGIILFNQLGFVWLILAYSQNADRAPEIRTAIAVVVFSLIAALAVASGNRRLHDLDVRARQGSMLALAEAIAVRMPEDSITFATENIVFPLQSTGRRVVSIPRPEPAAPSLGERQKATDLFFDVATSREERRRLIKHWGATHVVLSSVDLKVAALHELRLLGPSTRLSHGVEMITIDQIHAYPQKAIP